jgi:hypothetical protein
LATDFDTNDVLTFSLGLAPVGVTIDPASGLLTWRPTRAHADQSYSIAAVVTDNGLPSLSTTQTFIVTVSGYLEIAVGATTALAGQNAAVPINVQATAGLVDMDFNLTLPTNRLNNPALQGVAAEIGTANIQAQNTSLAALSFAARSGQAFYGPGAIATLAFSCAAGQASAFVPLQVQNAVATVTNDESYASIFTRLGRVTVIGESPLLEPVYLTNGARGLALFGNPGTTIQLNARSQVDAAWNNLLQATLQTTTTNTEVVDTNVTLYYQATRLDNLATTTIAASWLTLNKSGNQVLPPPTVRTVTNMTAFLTLRTSGMVLEYPDFALVTPPAHGSAIMVNSNTVAYTPVLNYVGFDSFTVQLDDGVAVPQVVTVTLLVVNPTIIAMDDNAGGKANELLVLNVAKLLDNDRHSQSQPIMVSSVSATSTNGGTVTLDGTNVLYQPLTNFVGRDEFTYTVADAGGNTAVAKVVVDVLWHGESFNLLRMVAANSTMELWYFGIPGRSYVIQRTTNLVDGVWLNLGTNTASLINGVIHFIDPNPPPGQAFYRSRSR